MIIEEQTVACLQNPASDEVFFGLKGRKFAAGKRMWPGGKMEKRYASLEECIRDETVVETGGLVINTLSYRGAFEVLHQGQPDFRRRVHIFYSNDFSGTATATDEMLDPQWYAYDEFPWDEMPFIDMLWMPTVLRRRPNVVWMRFTRRPDDGTLVSFERLAPPSPLALAA